MPMNRVDRTFATLRARGAKALMPFITAGDPDLPTTEALLPALERAGAQVCELGVPFSDPLADGPVIQASMTHALEHGVRPTDILAMAARLRDRLSLCLVMMVSYSIVHRLAPPRFIHDAQVAGIDGFIVPDLPLEEAAELRDRLGAEGLVFSMLIAPTTPPARAERIARACTGFVYLLARAGVTGEQQDLAGDLAGRVGRLRQVTDLPIAVGFGIADRRQVRAVVESADAAIVGSAIMRRVAAARGAGSAAVLREVEQFVADLAAGLRPAGTKD
jgi:tryptophan synthase alpha chain